MLASKADIPIAPIHITGTEKVLKSGSFLINPGQVKVTVGKPVYPKGKEIQNLISECRNQVIELGASIAT